jgi:hypothetical protein
MHQEPDCFPENEPWEAAGKQGIRSTRARRMLDVTCGAAAIAALLVLILFLPDLDDIDG